MRKKIIPALIAIFLIIIIAGGAAGKFLYEKYSYSKETADLNAYFGIGGAQEAAIILNDGILEEKGMMENGHCYLTLEAVHTYLNDRFYVDYNEGLLLYTLPEETVRVGIGEVTADGYAAAISAGDRIWLALEYVKKYSDFSYTLYAEPSRVVLTTVWEERLAAEVTKDSAVRLRGGVKSEILSEVKTGDKLVVLEELENWDCVRTMDGYIGYLEKKHMSEVTSETPVKDTGYTEPDYYGNVRAHKINMVWHQVTAEAANSTIYDMIQGVTGVNVLSPTWFFLYDNSGLVESIASKSYVDWAHQNGYEVWALIDDFTHSADNGVVTKEVLSYTSKRQMLIEAVMGEVIACGIDGINVDFEKVSEDAGEDFIQFIRELSVECRKNGIVLSIDNYVPQHFNAHYHWKEQGVMADYVIIMGYDEHWAGCDEAGSVASIGYVEDGIKRMVQEVPANKVINAIPLYTRIWNTDANGAVSSQAVGIQTASNYLLKNNVAYSWDEETCQNYASFETSKGTVQVWLEDEQSLAAKISIMKKYELGGISAWKLGFDEGRKNIWSVIAGFFAE